VRAENDRCAARSLNSYQSSWRTHMARHSSIIAVVVGLFAVGCASGPPSSDLLEPDAMKVAVEQGQSEFRCPAAAGSVVSRETATRSMTLSAPQYQGSRGLPTRSVSRETASTRSTYVIEVAGCSRKATYTVSCPDDGAGCFIVAAKY